VCVPPSTRIRRPSSQGGIQPAGRARLSWSISAAASLSRAPGRKQPHPLTVPLPCRSYLDATSLSLARSPIIENISDMSNSVLQHRLCAATSGQLLVGRLVTSNHSVAGRSCFPGRCAIRSPRSLTVILTQRQLVSYSFCLLAVPNDGSTGTWWRRSPPYLDRCAYAALESCVRRIPLLFIYQSPGREVGVDILCNVQVRP